jgi:hypothetical protein
MLIEQQAIGRGGQAFVTCICYNVFSRSLTRLMESSPVPLDSFGSLMMGDVVTIHSVYTLVVHFFEKSSLRVRLYMLWMIPSSIYALFFQTLLSAMTGYNGSYNSRRNLCEYPTNWRQPFPRHSYKQRPLDKRSRGLTFAWSTTLYMTALVLVYLTNMCCTTSQMPVLWSIYKEA